RRSGWACSTWEASSPRCGKSSRRRRSTPTRCSRPTATWSAKAWSNPGPAMARSCCAARLGRRPAGSGRGGDRVTDHQDPAAPVIQTRGLSKRYRKVPALSDCTITVPEGRISALIGPNGAGKTTLLRLLAGLAKPTGGAVAVLGCAPRQDPAFLADIGFLAQQIPLYRRFSAEDHIGAGAHLNPRWDAASVRQRLSSLHISLDQAVGTLSGGQRAQLALALTLAKRP